MSKHTEGPWMIGGPTVLRPTWTIFHKPFGLGDVAEVYEERDAALIAAAPDGFEVIQAIELALRMNMPASEILDENSPIRDAMRAYMRKATGEQQ